MKENDAWDDDGGRPINPNVLEAATCGASQFKIGDRVVCVSAPKEWLGNDQYINKYLNKVGTIASNHDTCQYCNGRDFSVLFDGDLDGENVALGVENMLRIECSQCGKSVHGIKGVNFGGISLDCCPDCVSV